MKGIRWIVILLCAVLAVGCDRLDDGDDGRVAEVLPGVWAFSYELHSDEETGLDFNYRNITFQRDGTCTLSFLDHEEARTDEEGNYVFGDDGEPIYDPVYGVTNGTYQATSAMIRIESDEFDGQDHTLLWRVVSLSERRVVAEYDFEFRQGQTVTAVVTLDKQQ